MTALILVVHVVVSLALILIVLLQTGKGAEMGASFGGSNQTVFGSRGAATFMSKITTAAAILFMLTSLSLAYLSGQKRSSVISDTMPASEAPLEQAAPAAPAPPPVDTIPTEPVPDAPAMPQSPPSE